MQARNFDLFDHMQIISSTSDNDSSIFESSDKRWGFEIPVLAGATLVIWAGFKLQNQVVTLLPPSLFVKENRLIKKLHAFTTGLLS